MDLTYGQRQWMLGHIADGLRTLGLDVTPQAVERELTRADGLMRGASAVGAAARAVPDPYADALVKMRATTTMPQATFAEQWKTSRSEQLAAERTRYPASTPARPLSDADRRRLTPPDPYATRQETR